LADIRGRTRDQQDRLDGDQANRRYRANFDDGSFGTTGAVQLQSRNNQITGQAVSPVKKTRQTPQSEIQLARKRWKEMQDEE